MIVAHTENDIDRRAFDAQKKCERVVVCETHDEMTACACTQAARFAFADGDRWPAGRTTEFARRWIEAQAAIPIVLRCAALPSVWRELPVLSRSGVDVRVSLREYDDIDLLLRAEGTVGAHNATMIVLQRLGNLLHANVAFVVACALVTGERRVKVAEFCFALGKPLGTVTRLVQAYCGMSVPELLALSLCLHVAYRVTTLGQSAKEAMIGAGYAERAPFSTFVMRHTGLTPVELRGADGFNSLIQYFVRRLEQHQTVKARASALAVRNGLHKCEQNCLAGSARSAT